MYGAPRRSERTRTNASHAAITEAKRALACKQTPTGSPPYVHSTAGGNGGVELFRRQTGRREGRFIEYCNLEPHKSLPEATEEGGGGKERLEERISTLGI